MAKWSADAQLLRSTEDYLKSYTFNSRLIQIEEYEKEYDRDGYEAWNKLSPRDIPLAHARMFEVKYFIMGMENSDEKLFLYYRYIKNESIERCAELLNISRSSAYRLRDRALSLAASLKGRNESAAG